MALTGIGSSVPTPDTVSCLLRPSPRPHQSHLAKTRHDDAAACKTQHERAGIISNVEEFVLLLKKADLSLTEYGIQVFAFVPDPTGYVTVLHKTDGSLTRCAWHNVPRELDSVLEREAPKGVRHVTVGVDGSYALILNSGAVWWGSNVPARLHQLLEDAERKNRPVAVSIISMIARRVGAHLLLFLAASSKDRLPLPHLVQLVFCRVRRRGYGFLSPSGLAQLNQQLYRSSLAREGSRS